MSSNNCAAAIILAAGEGTRMRSTLPKVLHEIGGLPMIGHVIKAVAETGCDEIAVVVGAQEERVRRAVGESYPCLKFFEQSERQGTGHAVLAAQDFFQRRDNHIIYILYGDTPLVVSADLKRAAEALQAGADLVVFGFLAADPTGYGRLIEKEGELIAIVEDKDATAEQKKINFCNAGMMAVRAQHLLPLLKQLKNNNAKNEYYLTDLVALARGEGLSVCALLCDWKNVRGVNDQIELAEAEELWQDKKRKELMLQGVTLRLPKTIYLSHDVEIEPGVEIGPHVVIGTKVVIKQGSKVLSFSHLEGATIGERSVIGPFARLRPGTRLGQGVKVGNFCELKKTEIGKNSKVSHLSYLGDATIGEDVNIGAGTITCNYDGVQKWPTIIDDDVFVGSQTSFIAPVRIGAGSLIAAGSVITADVPEATLAIARVPQIHKARKNFHKKT